MRRSFVCLAGLSLLGLAACGGGGSSPSSSTPVVAPTPVPINYGGTYRGTMVDNFSTVLMRYDAELVLTHANGVVTGDHLLLTSALGNVARYPIGSANVTAGQFNILGTYNSTGCGRVAYQLVGRYSGDAALLNVTYTGDTQGCGHFDMRGELSK